ncbi:hypothetical protein A2U01_0099231, partial [Trifolium medium]|nr:hypothetical protein [Trifolium medium]
GLERVFGEEDLDGINIDKAIDYWLFRKRRKLVDKET